MAWGGETRDDQPYNALVVELLGLQDLRRGSNKVWTQTADRKTWSRGPQHRSLELGLIMIICRLLEDDFACHHPLIHFRFRECKPNNRFAADYAPTRPGQPTA